MNVLLGDHSCPRGQTGGLGWVPGKGGGRGEHGQGDLLEGRGVGGQRRGAWLEEVSLALGNVADKDYECIYTYVFACVYVCACVCDCVCLCACDCERVIVCV